MILVLADKISHRLTYTLDFVFTSRGLEYQVVTDPKHFIQAEGIKLNYSSFEAEQNSIIPSELMYSTEIVNYNISYDTFGKMECMCFNGIVDPLASIFYTLVRYEEYLEHNSDEHGRFCFNSSCLSDRKWVKTAMCDRWAFEIIEFAGAEVLNRTSNVKFVPTFDIDNTFAYKLKKGKRKWMSVARDLVRFDYKRIGQRAKVKKGGKDPYDTFSLIKDISIKHKDALLFWLVGDSSPKDRNIDTDIKEHRDLITRMNDFCQVNLHPSYASNSERSEIIKEKKRLENIVLRPVIRSRQHFLKLKLPDTYRILTSIGFEHEYSMGFAESAGFRCGTARPHLWFDLQTGEITTLMIHPFVYMDGTLREYMKLSVQESKAVIKELHREVLETGGDFIFIWHNETIGDYGNWKGWKEVLNYTLNLNE